MKKLLIISAFVAIPLFSGAAIAECQHGHYLAQETDNLEALIAKETDPEALRLLKEQLAARDALEASPVVSYN